MLKLIYNELYKVLHKKSTYIILIITTALITLVSTIYKMETPNYGEPYFEQTGTEIDIKLAKEMNEYYKKYNEDNWQYYKLDDYYNIAYTYYNYGNNKDEFENIKTAFANDDWKYFANKELNEEKDKLTELNTLRPTLTVKEQQAVDIDIFTTKTNIETLEYRLKEDVKYGNDYLNEAIDVINNTSSSVILYEQATKDEKQNYEESIKDYYENKYILENKEDTNNSSDLKCLLTNFFQEYSFMILVFGIMISGAMVSDEYSKGTIKSLLITPYKRSTIILSKFLTSILLTISFIFITYLIQILIGGLILGFGSLNNHVVIYNIASKSLEIMSIYKYCLINMLATLPQILLLITLAFSLSTIIGSTAFSIAITFAGLIGSSIINVFAVMYKIKILKYFVTTNWDFNLYLFGKTSQYGTSLTHAIVVCIIYFLIMVITTFIVFKRKNIKNI